MLLLTLLLIMLFAADSKKTHKTLLKQTENSDRRNEWCNMNSVD
jgi:heme exporter protein D